MPSLSEKLRRERELRGISLKQISEDTKIGVRFLEALEQDRLEVIPGEFYRRSYLRAYAKYLGLDEDRAVNAYAFAQQDRPEGSGSPTDTEPPGRMALAWIVLFVLVTGVMLLFWLRASPQPSSGVSSEPAAPPAQREAVAVPADVPDLAPREGAITVPLGELRLKVLVGEPCWLEIEGDGELLTTGLKEVGFSEEFTVTSELRLWVGNAGGVSLWINERPLRPLGGEGQVRKDVAITPENFMEFVDTEAERL